MLDVSDLFVAQISTYSPAARETIQLIVACAATLFVVSPLDSVGSISTPFLASLIAMFLFPDPSIMSARAIA
jgi:hypothetical protein